MDDEGKELAQAPISAANVARLAAWLHRNRKGMKVAADVARVATPLLLVLAPGLAAILEGRPPARKRVGRGS